jgi:hypothetical protein
MENAMKELSDAWDEHEAEEESTKEIENVIPVEQPQLSETVPDGDTDISEDKLGESDDADGVSGEAEPTDIEPTAEADGQGTVADAPNSWSATARETWKDIPQPARDYIQKREQQMEQGMRKNAEQAQRASQMDQVLAPHQQYFAMNGGPGQSIKTLLEAGSGLQMGSPIQKAQIVSNLIKQFGIDISTLDNMLVGQAPAPEQQQQNDIQQAVQQAVAPYQQHMQQIQQQQQFSQQQAQQGVNTDVEAFSTDPKNEFYRDVRADMADILDMAANRGRNMGMDEAYETACRLNPEISKIINARAQQESLADKRAAAASISGTPGGPGGRTPPNGMRDTIMEAWNTTGRT